MSVPDYRNTTQTPYTTPYSKYYAPEYFSTMDLSVFFDPGDGTEPKYIDELTSLSFTLTERVVPVYGYASYTANRIVHGSRIVQGQLTINMGPGDYLHELMNRVSEIITGELQASVEVYAKPDPTIDPAGYARWSAQQKSQYWDAITALANPPDDAALLASMPYFTAPGFTIVMITGDVDTVDLSRNSGRVRTIDGVHLFSTGQQLDLSPEAIGESFGFIAVDVNSSNRMNPFS